MVDWGTQGYFEINHFGTQLDATILEKVSSLSVSTFEEPSGTFEIVFSGQDFSSDSINQISNKLSEGSEIEIKMGYKDNMKTLIKGVVMALEAEYSADGHVCLLVSGYDQMYTLARGNISRVFEGSVAGSGMADYLIVEKLAMEANLRVSYDSTPELKKARVQHGTSNFTFIKNLARVNGFELWMDDDTLCFMKERPSKKTIQLQWGKDLISLNTRLSIAGMVDKYHFQGWDEMQREKIDFEKNIPNEVTSMLSSYGLDAISKGSGEKPEFVLALPEIFSDETANNYVDKIVQNASGIIIASGQLKGNPDVVVGNVIELSEVGRFSGKYKIIEASHRIDGNSGYKTNFKARSIV